MKYLKLNDEQKTKIIQDLYIKEKKSFKQIADLLDTYPNKIRRDAKRLNIEIRDKSEAQKNALSNGSVEHPTKGKSRSEKTKLKIGLGVLESWDNLSEKELAKRKQRAKKQWEDLSDDQKQNMIKMANDAVRLSSKSGSKLEKFILQSLVADGYKVDFHKEQTLANTKLQIDLFIPKLNVAIEVDGPSHFLPVWGEDALNRNIKYDNKKTGLLLGKGCVLIRIKQTKDYSPSRASIIVDKLKIELEKIANKFPDIKNRTIEIGE